jgi:hypothetical protein
LPLKGGLDKELNKKKGISAAPRVIIRICITSRCWRKLVTRAVLSSIRSLRDELGEDAGFSPYQSVRSGRYNAAFQGWQ